MRPYYIDRESEHAQVPVGTRVLGDWGAMIPIDQGEVIQKGCDLKHLIRWDNGGEAWHEIRATRSVNGSPIGVWQA